MVSDGLDRARPPHVREARPEDATEIDLLLRALAAHEGTSASLRFSLEALEAALGEPEHRLRAVVAELSGRIVGCATYTWDFALWSGGAIVRIDDLIVRDGFRGNGIGTALMRALAGIAVAEGATMRWEVEVANIGAQRFYGRLGASLSNKIVARWDLSEMRSSAVGGPSAAASEAVILQTGNADGRP